MYHLYKLKINKKNIRRIELGINSKRGQVYFNLGINIKNFNPNRIITKT